MARAMNCVRPPLQFDVSQPLHAPLRNADHGKRSPESIGLAPQPKKTQPDPDSPVNLAGFFQTGTGELRYTGAIDGRALGVFQHQYMIFAGTTTVPVIHSVYVLEVSPNWPKVSIARRSPWSWLARVFGWTPGLMLDDPQFNRAFRVTSDDEDFAVALLTPVLQQFLLQKRNVTWRIDLGRLALFYPGKLRDDRVVSSVERLRGFLQRVPDELEAWGL